MTEIRFYRIIILLLIMINLGILGFFWLNKPEFPPHPMHFKKPDIAKELGIEGQNAKEVAKFEKTHHQEKIQLVDKDRQMHQRLFQMIGSEENPTKLLDSIHKNKVVMDSITYEFFQKVAEFCNDDQLMRLRKFVEGPFMPIPPHKPHR